MRQELIVFIAAAILVGGYFFNRSQQSHVDRLQFNLIGAEKQSAVCLKAKHCLVAYVAPWCPACHQFISQNQNFKALFQQKGIELMYIVGADKVREKEVEMKNNLGEAAVLDTPTHLFRKIHNVNYFPTVYFMAADGKVKAQGSDAYDELNKLLNQ